MGDALDTWQEFLLCLCAVREAWHLEYLEHLECSR